MKAFFLGSVSMVVFSLSSHATSIYTGPIADPGNGHTYYLLSPDTWANSEAFAQTLGGNLTTVRNAAENQWIFNTFYPYIPNGGPGDPELWIGLYNPTQDAGGGNHADNFVWVDGEPVNYTNWYPGEPNNTGGIEYYAVIRSPADPILATWNDLSNAGGGDAGNVWGVVEVVPEPSVQVLMLGIGAALALRSSRRRPSRLVGMPEPGR